MCVMLIHLSPSSASEEILRRCQISITGGPRWARVLRLEGPRPLLHHRRKGEGVEVRRGRERIIQETEGKECREGERSRVEQIADLKLGDLFDEAGGVYQSVDLIKSVHDCSQTPLLLNQDLKTCRLSQTGEVSIDVASAMARYQLINFL